MDCFSRSLELHRLPFVLLCRGNCLTEMGRLDAANEDYSAAIEMDPEDPRGLLYRGTNYHDQEVRASVLLHPSVLLSFRAGFQ